MKRIVICGSMKFKDIMIAEQHKLALEGNVVLLPTICPKDYIITEEDKDKFMEVHREKIRNADEVYIINAENYMGEDTIEELIYATRCNIPIKFYMWGRTFNEPRHGSGLNLKNSSDAISTTRGYN